MMRRMLLALSVALIGGAAGPAPRDAKSCAELVRQFPGAPCSFDLSRFRFDDKLLRARSTGRVHVVRTVRDVEALRPAPGDEIVFASAEWRDAAIGLHADGTPQSPVIVSAQAGAVFTGTSSAAFSGSNVVVRGLKFERGAVVRDDFVVFRLGDGANNPCNHCAADGVVIDGYNSAPRDYDTIKVFYMVLAGSGITVANSTLANKKNAGTMIAAEEPHDYLFLKNRISGFSAGAREGDKNHKLMQLGWSGVGTHPSYSALIGNVFERATGENETISIKASDVVVRGNTFRANRGTLNLRSANRVLVENNVFDGTGAAGMGGVRIEGRGHWIVHNLFRRLVAPENYFYWPIAIHAASDEELRDGAEDYARVKDVVIAGNRFEHDNMPPIAFGIYADPARSRTLAPKNVFLIGNLFSGSGPQPLQALDGPPDIVMRDNKISP